MTAFKCVTMAARTLAAALLLIALPYIAHAERHDLDLTIDIAQLLKLKRPAATIVVGNPSIADATVRSGTLMVLMGKSYGSTNLIALDGAGQEIVHLNLTVSPPEFRTLSLFRGTNRESYSCNPRCDRVLALGDDIKKFKDLNDQYRVKTENALGDGSSSSGGGSPQ